jgi:hypothetical protein
LEVEVEVEAEEQFQKKIEPVDWFQDHICNLHKRYFPLQYEVKITFNEGL